MKRKDVIFRNAAVIAAVMVITATATHMYDAAAHHRQVETFNRESIIMPAEKWGVITIYDAETKEFKKYSGYMTFQKMEIMGENGVSINCDEAKMLSKMIFNIEKEDKGK